jgi:hypothetical protein
MIATCCRGRRAPTRLRLGGPRFGLGKFRGAHCWKLRMVLHCRNAGPLRERQAPSLLAASHGTALVSLVAGPV